MCIQAGEKTADHRAAARGCGLIRQRGRWGNHIPGVTFSAQLDRKENNHRFVNCHRHPHACALVSSSPCKVVTVISSRMCAWSAQAHAMSSPSSASSRMCAWSAQARARSSPSCMRAWSCKPLQYHHRRLHHIIIYDIFTRSHSAQVWRWHRQGPEGGQWHGRSQATSGGQHRQRTHRLRHPHHVFVRGMVKISVEAPR